MIGVLGGTGTIGSNLVRRLAETGTAAVALVRDPARAELPLPTVAADLLDPASLLLALQGADQLFLLTPHGPQQDAQERAALEAAETAGVRRVVKVSACVSSLGPDATIETAATHWRSERRIEASGVRHAFLRPSFMMQNLADLQPQLGVLAAPMGHSPIAMVDARDVADAALSVLLDDALPDRAWQLTGPAGVTFDEVAEALGARYVPVPRRVAAIALRLRGASKFEVDHAMKMAALFASGAEPNPSGEVEQLTGLPARPLTSYIADELKVGEG